MRYELMRAEASKRAEEFIRKNKIDNEVVKEEVRSIYSFMATAYSLGLRKQYKEFLKEVIKRFGRLGFPLEIALEDFDKWYKEMRKATGDWINEVWGNK